MKKILFLSACALSLAGQGQSLWHFSSALTSPWAGTARYMATGAALSSLGNDPSAIVDNPATAATYRASEISLTGLLGLDQNTIIGQAQLPAFHWGSIIQMTEESVLAFSLDSRTSRFQPLNWSKDIYNPSVSQVDAWLAQAGDLSPTDCFQQGLYGPYAAYQAYVLEYDGLSLYPLMTGKPDVQYLYLERDQRISQTQGSVAVRTDHISLGAGLEYLNLRSSEKLSILEYPYAQDGYLLNIYTRQMDSLRSGGFRIRLGLLAKLGEGTRISAFWTGTSLLSSNWHYRYRVYDNPENPPNIGVDNFELYQDESFRTVQPSTAGLGIAQVIQNQGFVSAEYRYTGAPDNPIYAPIEFLTIGQEIGNELKGSHDLRIGTEWRQDAQSFRAGYRLSTKASNFKEHSGYQQLSTGWGLRGNEWFFDLALVGQFRTGQIIHPLSGETLSLPSSSILLVATYSFRLI
ncbi:MAG: hypothetical protein P8N56_03710 [Schleiferiaceae bacterium]|nr:hypothetical protein [Schleiferiaceae bacterium]